MMNKGKKEFRTFKCIYCGRFISNKDFNENKAIASTGIEWDEWREDVREVNESYHVKRQVKYNKDIENWNIKMSGKKNEKTHSTH